MLSFAGEIARQERQLLRNRTDQLLAEVAETKRKLNETDTEMTKLSESNQLLDVCTVTSKKLLGLQQ